MDSPQLNSTSTTTTTTTTATEVGTITTITTTITIKRARDGTTTTSTECSNVTIPWVTEPSTAKTVNPDASKNDRKHPIWLNTTNFPIVSLANSEKRCRFYLKNYSQSGKYNKGADQTICILEMDSDKPIKRVEILKGITNRGISSSNGEFDYLYWYNLNSVIQQVEGFIPAVNKLEDGVVLFGQ